MGTVVVTFGTGIILLPLFHFLQFILSLPSYAFHYPTPDYVSIHGTTPAASPLDVCIHLCSCNSSSEHHPKQLSPWLSASLPPSASPTSASCCLFSMLWALNLMILTVRHSQICCRIPQHVDHCPTFHATSSLYETASQQGKKLLCLTFRTIPSKLWLLVKVLNFTQF